MSSSIAMATHVHPDLEHEFEYPSPPPPVPDRCLKPAYLKSPIAKSRLIKQNSINSSEYIIIQKSKPLPFTVIQQFTVSTPNDSTSTRTMSSRHYCGSIPVSDQISQSYVNSTPIKTSEDSFEKDIEERSSKAFNCWHPSTKDNINKTDTNAKSLSASNRKKRRKQNLSTDFDEATNGLAIRLPAPIPNSTDLANKQRIKK